MKIKSKLIAGGLMSIVSCALVGSITGTFAWVQYSNNATASMHGVSVNTTQNIQLKLEKKRTDSTAADYDSNDYDWFSGNLVWNDSTKPLQSIKSLFAASELSGDNYLLTPVSNGVSDGTKALNANWYGNPNGQSNQLPSVASGYMQFSFNVRLAETIGSTTSYPAGKLYVTDIASKIWTGNDINNNKISFALRMHINLGDQKYFVVSPSNQDGESTTLSARYIKETKYDFEETAKLSYVDYQLPQAQYSQIEEEADQNSGNPTGIHAGDFKENAGSLVSLPFSDIFPTQVANTAELNSPYSVNIPANSSVKVTVTVWLEGFAQYQKAEATYYSADEAIAFNAALADALNSTDALTSEQAVAYNAAISPAIEKAAGDTLNATEAAAYNATLGGAVAEGDIKSAAQFSPWWDFEATIGREIAAGFELTAVKA